MIMRRQDSGLKVAGLLGLALLLSGGCATSPIPAGPLDPSVVQALDQRARSAQQLGLQISRTRGGDLQIDGARSITHGAAVASPLTQAGGPISLPLRIGEHPATAAIFSGITASFTDEAHARQVDIVPIGTPLKRTSVEGPLFSGFQYLGVARSIRIGPHFIYSVPIGILDDQRGLSALPNRPVGCDLILGIDFLRAFASVTFDLPGRRLTASHAETYTPDVEHLICAVPLKRGFPGPVVDLLINGEGPFPALIDTSLDVGLWMPLHMADMLRVPAVLAPGRPGLPFVPAQAVSLSMGGFTAESVPCVVSRAEFAQQDPSYAVVGMGALQAYRVTFDFKHRKLYIERP